MSRTGLAEELPELEASLLEDPSPRNVMRVADACRLAGVPARALELLEALVSDRPTAIAPLVLMAWCLDDLGRHEESRARLEDLRAIDPANPWAAGRAVPQGPTAEGIPEERAEDATAGVIPEEPTEGATAEVIPEERAEDHWAAAVSEEPAGAPAVEAIEEDSPQEPSFESMAAQPDSPELPAEAELDPLEDEAVEASTGSDVFEIPAESDLAAAVAELAGVRPAPEMEAEPEMELEVEPEPELGAEPEMEMEPEPEPEPSEPAARYPDEEAEAEPERALTAEQLADIPPSPLYSATLAEIFERQGFEEKAMEIYAEVVRTHPERVDLRERIAELERRTPGEPGR